MTINFIIHCDEWPGNDSNTMKFKFKKYQTGEIIASKNFNFFASSCAVYGPETDKKSAPPVASKWYFHPARIKCINPPLIASYRIKWVFKFPIQITLQITDQPAWYASSWQVPDIKSHLRRVFYLNQHLCNLSSIMGCSGGHLQDNTPKTPNITAFIVRSLQYLYNISSCSSPGGHQGVSRGSVGGQ